jgi:hypothetical protein
MTTQSTYPTVTDVNAAAHGELLDDLMEAVGEERGPAAGAALIADLAQEMCATFEWLHRYSLEPDDAQADELIGTTRLSEGAQEHRQRMRSRPDPTVS